MKKILSIILTILMMFCFSVTANAENDFIYGDVNADKKVNIRDATEIQRYVARLITLEENQLFAADFDGSSYISINDCTALQKHLVDLPVNTERKPVAVASGKIPADTGAAIDFNVDKNKNDYSEYAFYGHNGEDEYAEVISTYEEYAKLVKTPYPEYDEEFFKENSLIFLYRWTSSGSYRYTVDSVSVKDNTIYVRYTYHFSMGWVTDDIGNWNIYVSVKKSDIANTDKLYVFGKSKSAYDPMLNNCKLIVNDKDITSETYVKMTSSDVYIPLLAVSQELGGDIQWQNDNVATISFDDATYTLNTDDITLIEDGDAHQKNLIGHPDGSVRKHILLEDDIALDQTTIIGFLSNRDAMPIIDRNNKTVTITIDFDYAK